MKNGLLSFEHYDLVTPDGKITRLHSCNEGILEATVRIENISSRFMGFYLEPEEIFFNLKSTLAQLGVNAVGKKYDLDPHHHTAEVLLQIEGIDALGKEMLMLLTPGAYIGKLFAADESRRVRNPDYLLRMTGRTDRKGRPLLYLGNPKGCNSLILEKVNGKTVAFIPLLDGLLHYDDSIHGFLPTLARGLHHPELQLRSLLHLHQKWKSGEKQEMKKGELLLVRTLPLHIRTVFGRVVDALLPKGYFHTSASILDPTTSASGDVYELFGQSREMLTEIPLEFYTLEPFKEHVFFADRDQLQLSLERPEALFDAFEKAPAPLQHKCATFVVKGTQLLNLTSKDWIIKDPHKHPFPGLIYPEKQAFMVEGYIHDQPSYPFLKAIEEGLITSEGVLLTRYFPSPLMKRMLLSDHVRTCLKRIYFQHPSLSHGDFFSHEDRSFLHDLAKFAIPVFWVDQTSGKILQYVAKPEKDTGMFVPLPFIKTFLEATLFGVYGSNLMEMDFETSLTSLMKGVLEMRSSVNHPLLSKDTPIALVTGGGPGVMGVGNRVARSLEILSCANLVDFSIRGTSVVNEQKMNPYIDAKMTYRIDKLVERQAEFNLDFPIFVKGGIGTDFEYSVEEVRRKVGSTTATPVLLLGSPGYWKEKISSRFQCNLRTGTIAGSEWVSNCFYCVETPEQGLQIYRQFFSNTLPIGKNGPVYKDGFAIV